MQRLSSQMAEIHFEDPVPHLLYHECGCPDLDMKYNIQTFRIPISILRPLLRFLFRWHITEQDQEQEFHVQLKHIVDVLQKANGWAIECVEADASTTRINAELVTSNLEILKSLKEDIVQIATLRPSFRYDMNVSRYHVEVLISFIRSLLQNLKDISHIAWKAPERNIPVTKELAQIEEKLKFLAAFLWLIFNLPKSRDIVRLVASNRMKEYILPDLLRKLNTLLLELKQVRYNESDSTRVRLSDDNPIMNKHVLGFVDYLILKLRELSNNKASFMVVAVKIQIDILVDELRFFRNSLMDLLLIEDHIVLMESLRISIEDLIIDTGFFIYFSLDKVGDEDVTMANYLSFGLPDLLVAVDTVHQQARAVFQKYFPLSWQSNWSCTNGLEFVDFLIKKLQELLDSNKAASTDPLKRQIVMVIEEMINLRKYFSEMAELMGKSQMEFLLTRFRDAAYIAERITDSFIDPAHIVECITGSFAAEEDLLWFQMLDGEKKLFWLQMLGLYVVIKDVKVVQEKVKSILKLTCVTHVHNNITVTPSCALSHANIRPNVNAVVASKVEMQNKAEDADKLVGLKDAITRIIEQLTGGSKQLKILSIVGMPGLGKTTLANSVYKHSSVDNYFDVRAWYCLSKFSDTKTLFSSILGHICQETNQCHGISVQDFAQKVYQNLKSKKYLIVLDDIWDIEWWNDLMQILPDDANESRILFTTRSNAVAKQVKSIPYALRLLSNEESCELLWLKLFGEKLVLKSCQESQSILPVVAKAYHLQ